MKSALALLAFTATATALPASYVEENHALLWSNFKAEHGKTYNGSEEAHRMQVFKKNMLKAADLEATSRTGARYGMNKFSDLTAEEFKAYHSLKVPVAAEARAALFTEAEVAALAGSSKDWRSSGAVTHVKNQAACGSCWSFSSTGAIEGANYLATGDLVSASEQHLVSCDKVDQGCNGGLMENAYSWLLRHTNGQIVTEAAYPYVSGGGRVPACRDTAGMDVAATISNYRMVPQDEDQLAAALISTGPVAIAVDATSWQSYTGGVVDNCISYQLDHGVLAVGVTPDYFIVKNSWGASWGESGYIRLQRGTNQCLIKEHGVLPQV